MTVRKPPRLARVTLPGAYISRLESSAPPGSKTANYTAAEYVEYSELGNIEIDGVASCTCDCMTSDCRGIFRLPAIRKIQFVGDHRSSGSGQQGGPIGGTQP
jgi:hypothetical protein